MMRDSNGHDVTTDSAELVEQIDRFAGDFLNARDASAILRVADEHPDCALAQAYAAAMHLYSQSREQIDACAAPLLERASALRSALTVRESLLIDALAAWVRNDFPAALALFERIAADWPRDLVAAKLAEFLFYEAPDYRRHLRFMERIAPVHQDAPPFLAMHAFALEMCREYERAERTARRAIELELHTPWAHHALAHLMLNQRRIREGLELMRELAPTWGSSVPSIQAHNWWHVALLDLAAGDADAALRVYHEHVTGAAPETVLEHVDAISLLWRIELAGRRTDAEWQALAPYVSPRANEQCFPFLNAHYAYALVRAGREDQAAAALAKLREFALRQSGPAARVFRDVGLPLVTACAAFAAGEPARCVVLLEPILGELPTVGGSDAQNDLFRQTYVVALLDSGRAAEARRRLDARIAGAAPTAAEELWLARA